MRRNAHKFMSTMLALVMTAGVFTGCGQESSNEADKKTSNKETTTTKATTEVKDFSYPLEGNKTLTYWVALNGNVSPNYISLAETPLYQEIFKRTGITVEFLHPAEGQHKEQLNLLLASGELPDIIEYNWLSFAGGPEKAILDGHLLELTDVFKQYAPNLTKVLAENPKMDKMVKTDSGNYFGFPFLRGHDDLLVFIGPMLRKNYLDELGLEVPETIDEWYTTLKTFKEDKGLAAPLTYDPGMIDTGAFMGAYGVRRGFYQQDGEIKFGQVEPGYKDFLQEFSKWYKEGLIDPDIATVDRKLITARMTGGDSGASVGFVGGNLGAFMQSMADIDPTYELIGAPYPVLKKGEKPIFGHRETPFFGVAAAITTACEDVETAARFLDYGYSEEGHMLFNFGIEGVSYDMVDGYPKYSDVIYNDPEGVPLGQAMGRYARSNYDGPFVQDQRYLEQYLPLPQQVEAYKTWKNTDIEKYILPPITPTPEESQEMATIMNEINTYHDEMYLKFLFGEESLDEFDNYVNTIKSMGLDRAIEIQTQALERFNNR